MPQDGNFNFNFSFAASIEELQHSQDSPIEHLFVVEKLFGIRLHLEVVLLYLP